MAAQLEARDKSVTPIDPHKSALEVVHEKKPKPAVKSQRIPPVPRGSGLSSLLKAEPNI
jgi:hypothetical protein